ISDAHELIGAIQRLPGMRLAGIYTHYSSVEEDAQFSREQLKRFAAAAGPLLRGQQIEYVHVNNSAAVLFEPRSVYNTVRPGLLVYGIMPSCSRRVPALLPQ